MQVHDNLTRALKSVKEEDRTQSDSLSSFYDGVQLTSRQLEKAFTAIGVKEYVEPSMSCVFNKRTKNTSQNLLFPVSFFLFLFFFSFSFLFLFLFFLFRFS